MKVKDKDGSDVAEDEINDFKGESNALDFATSFGKFTWATLAESQAANQAGNTSTTVKVVATSGPSKGNI